MKNSVVGLILWIVVSMAAGWVGSRFMPGEWYASLAKPSWNPPSSVFAPVWSTLYVLMGVAAWLVWRKVGFAGAPVAPLLRSREDKIVAEADRDGRRITTYPELIQLYRA